LIAGIGFGSILYPHGKRAFLVPESVQNNLTLLSALGRHSLAIYFVHQPVIILLLYFCAGIPLPFT
jgi:uncharacterized membrane protein